MCVCVRVLCFFCFVLFRFFKGYKKSPSYIEYLKKEGIGFVLIADAGTSFCWRVFYIL